MPMESYTGSTVENKKKEEVTVEQIRNLVETNKFPITEPVRSRCVDGRYESAGMGAIAKPGADAGDFFVVLAALRSLGFGVEQPFRGKILETIVAHKGGQSGFSFHTDEHGLEHGPGGGCGHLRQALLAPEAYGLKKEDVEAVFAELAALKVSGTQEDVLRGNHNEGAVTVIESDAWSIRPALWVGGKELQTFVYQKARHNQQLFELSRALGSTPEIANRVSSSKLLGALIEVSGVQLQETLQRLALGLPVYVVAFDRAGEARIEKQGHIGAKVQAAEAHG